ncbi:MAG: hypothetical protein M0C28_30910 [Candidatus Moduliflexus flocculans]|nr:hypothetical protein [Candidatus Moduliflexus flocculans]
MKLDSIFASACAVRPAGGTRRSRRRLRPLARHTAAGAGRRARLPPRRGDPPRPVRRPAGGPRHLRRRHACRRAGLRRPGRAAPHRGDGERREAPPPRRGGRDLGGVGRHAARHLLRPARREDLRGVRGEGAVAQPRARAGAAHRDPDQLVPASLRDLRQVGPLRRALRRDGVRPCHLRRPADGPTGPS